MSKRRSQHYIPVFLLKNFSNENKKSIGLFNINRKKFIRSASLRHQACRDHFYGKDKKIEGALSNLESITAPIIRIVEKQQTIPKKNTPEYLVLMLLALFMQSRTEYAGEAMNEQIDKLMKKIFKEHKKIGKYLHNIKIGINNPTNYTLGITAQYIWIIADMECKILQNHTKDNFIFSDNPIVKYNQFLEGRKWPASITGLVTKGLQIFFPISTSTCLLFYDQRIYKIGTRKCKIIPITSEEDIFEINKIQYLNADKNLFFNNRTAFDYLKNIINCCKKMRRVEKVKVKEFFHFNELGKKESSLIITSGIDVRSNPKLSFIKMTKIGKKEVLDNRLVQFRNSRVRRYIEMMEKKHKTTLDPHESSKY
jgi:hypothetical protein